MILLEHSFQQAGSRATCTAKPLSDDRMGLVKTHAEAAAGRWTGTALENGFLIATRISKAAENGFLESTLAGHPSKNAFLEFLAPWGTPKNGFLSVSSTASTLESGFLESCRGCTSAKNGFSEWGGPWSTLENDFPQGMRSAGCAKNAFWRQMGMAEGRDDRFSGLLTPNRYQNNESLNMGLRIYLE